METTAIMTNTFTHVVQRHYSAKQGFRNVLAAAGKGHAVLAKGRTHLTDGERFAAVCGEPVTVHVYDWTDDGRTNAERTDDAAKVTCKKCRAKLGL